MHNPGFIHEFLHSSLFYGEEKEGCLAKLEGQCECISFKINISNLSRTKSPHLPSPQDPPNLRPLASPRHHPNLPHRLRQRRHRRRNHLQR